MSINNNILHSSGFHQKNNHVRPVTIDHSKTTANRLLEKQEKESLAGSNSCPNGTTWHKKLKLCIDNKAIASLRKTKIQYSESESKKALRLAVNNL